MVGPAPQPAKIARGDREFARRDRHDPPSLSSGLPSCTGLEKSPIQERPEDCGTRRSGAAGDDVPEEGVAMPYGYSASDDARTAGAVRIDWKAALTGGMLVMVMAYVGLVAPAWRQVTALEGHVATLAASVAALNESRDGVTKATSLLERLEAQAARLVAAEATLERLEMLGDRLVAQTGPVEAAGSTLDRIDAVHEALVSHGGTITEAEAALADIEALTARAAATRAAARETATALADVDAIQEQVAAGLATLDAAAPVAERLGELAGTLARRAGDADLAAERLDGLVALESGLVRMTANLSAADAALVRLSDLVASLADASGTVGQLQRFVVDVMLLEPAIGRAVRALEPVVEFTRAGQRIEVKSVAVPPAAESAAVTEVARLRAEENR
jgi:hypothetical protein